MPPWACPGEHINDALPSSPQMYKWMWIWIDLDTINHVLTKLTSLVWTCTRCKYVPRWRDEPTDIHVHMHLVLTIDHGVHYAPALSTCVEIRAFEFCRRWWLMPSLTLFMVHGKKSQTICYILFKKVDDPGLCIGWCTQPSCNHRWSGQSFENMIETCHVYW
jgi:hypothetical protein